MNRTQLLSLRHPVLRLTLLAGALALFIYMSIRVASHQVKFPHGDGDWGVYYRAGAAMRMGRPIYTLDYGPLLTFKNAPVVALLLEPISLLPIGLARWVWLLGDMACLAVIIRFASRVIFRPDSPRIVCRWLIAGAMLLSAPYIFDALFSGSNALLALATMVAAFAWAWEGKGARAGAALALGIVLKIVPIALIPWLLLSRGRLAAIISLALSLAVLLAAPALVIGPRANARLLRQWPAHLAATESHKQESRVQNQSLEAMLTRFFSDTPARMMLVTLSPKTISLSWLLLSAGIASAVYLWIIRQQLRHRLDPGAALSLLLLFITLCNPLAWRYNFVALAVPFLYVLYALWLGIGRVKLAVALTEIAFLLHFAPELLQGLSARFWGGVCLAAAVLVCWADRAARRRANQGSAEPLAGSETINWQPAD